MSRRALVHCHESALTRLRRIGAPIATFVVVSFLATFAPIRTAHAVVTDAATAEAAETPNFHEQTSGVKSGADDASAKARATKSRKAPVSAKGSFTHSIDIQLPPGRVGMTPALALTYDSGSVAESAVGVGWSFGAPSITRSTRLGFPKVTGLPSTPTYDESAAIFASPSGELTPSSDGPNSVGARFAPVRESSPVRYERVTSNGQDGWIEHQPSGRKRLYGKLTAIGVSVPTASQARIVNELGTTTWLLGREQDFFGNFIDYEYHNEPNVIVGSARTEKKYAQRLPVLKKVSWGANITTSQAHFVTLETTVSPQSGPLDFLNGTTILDDKIDAIIVKVDGLEKWRYTLGYDTSWTGKRRLVTVARAGDAPETITLSYSTGTPVSGPQFVDMGELASGYPALRDLYTDDPLWFRQNPNAPGDWRGLFISGVSNPVRAIQSPGFRSGVKFLDVDGNGTTDAIYLGSGLGTTQSNILWDQSALQTPSTGGPISWAEPLPGSGVGSLQPQTGLPFFPTVPMVVNPNWQALWNRSDFGPSTVRELVDLDGDGDADAYGLSFNARVTRGAGVSGATVPAPLVDAGASNRFRLFTNTARAGGVTYDDAYVANWPSGMRPYTDVTMTSLASNGISAIRYKPNAEDDAMMSSVDLNADGKVDFALLKHRDEYMNFEPSGALAPQGAVVVPQAAMLRLYHDGDTPSPGELLSGDIETTIDNLVKLDHRLVIVEEEIFRRAQRPETFVKYETSAGRLHITELDNELPVVMMAMPGTLDKPRPDDPLSDYIPTPRSDNDWWKPRIDADGCAYVPLRDNYYLKGGTFGRVLIPGTFRFVPRAFLQRGNAARTFVSETSENQSQFARSLQQALNKGSPDECTNLHCKYPPHVNFTAQLADLNGDGLPDLLMAEPPQIVPFGNGGSYLMCNHGHEMRLNRGYGFEASKQETISEGTATWAPTNNTAAPLYRVANRDRFCASTSPPMSDGYWLGITEPAKFPTSAMAQVDINGDGRLDLVVAYQRKLTVQEVEQEVYVNTGRGFAPSSISLPSDVALAQDLGFPGLVDVAADALAQKWPRTGLPDMARFVDLDNDGLVDIVRAGMCVGLEYGRICSHAKWYRNHGRHPDRLERVLSSRGGWTTIEYDSPKSSNLTIPEGGLRPPASTRLVKTIRSAAGPESLPLDYPVEEIRFSYENFVKDLISNEVLGFEKVRAEFVNSFSQVPEESVFVTRTFDVQPEILDETGVALPVRHPLKGALRSTVTESGGWTATELADYYLEARGAGVRIRPLRSLRGDTSPSAITAWSGEETISFDSYGNPTEERSGDSDGYTVLATDQARTTITEYKPTDEAPFTISRWLVGLPKREQVFGYSEDIAGRPTAGQLLSETTKTYFATGAVQATTRVGIRGGTCAGANDDTTSFTYAAHGGLATTTESSGRVTTTSYEAKNVYPSSITTTLPRYRDGALNGTSSLTVNQITDYATGKVTSSTDPNGQTVTSTFDSGGRLKTRKGTDGTTNLETHTYQDFPPLRDTAVITTDKSGSTLITFQRQTQLDDDDHVLSVVEGAGTTAVPWSRKSKTRYDAFGRARYSWLPELVATLGDGSAATSGPKDETSYDGFDRPTQTLLADGTSTSVAYEPRSTLETNARGILTNRTFDAFGSLLTVERNPGGAASETTAHSFVRDGRGEILQVIDGDGSVRRFERDGGGRLLYVTLPALPGNPVSQFSMCHDLDDGLVRLESAAGRVVDITRDRLGRVVKTRGEDLSGLVVQTTQDYDDTTAGVLANGRLRKKVDESGVYNLTYDSYGRPASVTFAPSVRAKAGATNVAASYKADFVYSVAGHLKTATISTGLPKTAALVYTRDVKGRTTTVESKVAATSTVLAANLAYDVDDRLTFARYGNNTTGNWTFNPLNERLDRVAYKTSSNAIVAAVSYVYDANGNPLEENREREGYGGVYSFKLHSYDALDRLLQSISSSPAGYFVDDHTFSPGGNLLTAGGDAYLYAADATSQAATQVVNATTGSQRDLTYDLDGYLATDRHAPADGSVSDRTLAFDPMGCMRSITRLDTGVLGGETTASSTYTCGLDGKVVARATTKLDGSTSRRIDFAGLGEIRPDEGVFVLRVPVGGSVAVEDARLLSTGDRSTALSGYVANDARGSVLANLALTQQTLSKEAEFDAWGKKLDDFTTMSSPRHGFVGAEADDATGTYSFGARTYDPALRRWVSPDPLLITAPAVDEEAGDDLNLFSYAGGNPVKKTDRSGYCGACEAIAAGAVFGAVAGALHHAITTPNLNPKDFALGTLQAASRGAWDGAAAAATGLVLEAVAARGVTALVRATTTAETTAVKTATTAAKTEATAATNAAKSQAASAQAASKPPATTLCFAAGTPVATSSGLQPIETLRVGDAVWTKDDVDADAYLDTITRTFERTTSDSVEVAIHDDKNGDSIVVATAEHPFWVAGHGWTPAGELKEADVLSPLSRKGSTDTNTRIRGTAHEHGERFVYNLEVGKGHSFFVGESESWVHNTCEAPKPTAAAVGGKVNLNNNNAVSKFGVYEVTVNKQLYKVGKADLNRVTQSSGQPTRLHAQVRVLAKTHGTENVSGKVVQNLGKTTTAQAKAAETARLQAIYDKTGKVPPGNARSFQPKP